MHVEDLASRSRRLESQLESERRQAKKRESEIKDRWWDEVESKKKIANMEKDHAVGVVKSEMASVKAGFHEASTCGEFHLCIAGPTSPS